MSDVVASVPSTPSTGASSAPQASAPAPSSSQPDKPVVPKEAAPAQEPAEKAEAEKAEAKRRFKLKVNNQEEEWDEDKVLEWAQKGRASHKVFEDAAKARKEAEEKLAKIKDPRELRKILQEAGVDFRKVSEEYLFEQLEEDNLTPEQKELRELKRFKEEQERLAQERAQQEEQARLQAAEEHYTQHYDNQIVKALEASALPRSPGVIRRVAQHMLTALESDIDLDPADAIEMVRADYATDIKSVLGGLNENDLLQLLGDDVAGKIRKADLARVKTAPTQPRDQSGRFVPKAAEGAPSDNSPKKLSSEDFRKAIEEDTKKFFSQLRS